MFAEEGLPDDCMMIWKLAEQMKVEVIGSWRSLCRSNADAESTYNLQENVVAAPCFRGCMCGRLKLLQGWHRATQR